MKKYISCMLLFTVFFSSFLFAKDLMDFRIKEFSVEASNNSDSMNAQIEWPFGEYKDWNGPVVVFISSTNPMNRDGWGVRSLETVWAERSPLKDLALALLEKRQMVVRFDNPGVLDPSKQCREKIRAEGLTDAILFERCFDLNVLQNQTPERYIKNLEEVLARIEKLVPASKKQLVLIGFSEGLSHVIEIVKHGRFRPKKVISIGSPAQSLKESTRWQAIDRIVELMEKFDLNHDGVITSEEMQAAHAIGVGSFVGNIKGLLPPNGKWNKSELWKVRNIMEGEFKDILKKIANEQDSLQWNEGANGVLVPDITTAAINAHFTSEVDPVKVLSQYKIPGLWLWGALDQQINTSKQQQWIMDNRRHRDKFEYITIHGRHHLLSLKEDKDWFEIDYAKEVANFIVPFLLAK